MKRILLTILFCGILSAMPAFAIDGPVLKIEVRGIQGNVRANVESRLLIERKAVDGHLSADAVEHFARTSLSAVRDAMAPYGYYQPAVSTEMRRDGRVWKLTYNIRAGAPVRIQSVNIHITGPGAENGKIKRFVKLFPLKTGDIFNATIYTSARDNLFDVVNNQGYVKAIARESKVLVNTETHTAAINLILDTKERYFFGKLTFNNSVYDPEFMQRFNMFNEDEPFSSKKLLQYQQDMNNSRYFKQVIVIPDIAGAEDLHIPLQASIVPINYRRYAFGLGYGTFTQLRFTAGVTFKRLTDTGQSLDAQLKLSSVLSGVALKYFIPGKNPLTQQWIIGANYQKFIPKNGFSLSKSVAFGYSEKMHHWQVATNMNYLWERYRIKSEPRHNSQLLYPNLNLSYLKTDSIVQPTYGRS